MDHGLEWSVPTSSSHRNVFENTKQVKEPLFWCTFMIFARSDGQWFIPTMIIYKEGNYTQDLHWNLPSEWLFHNMPSGYMDKDVWMKAMSLLSSTCVAS